MPRDQAQPEVHVLVGELVYMGRPGRDLLHHPSEIRPGIIDSERQPRRTRQQLSRCDQFDTGAFTSVRV